MTTHQGTPTGGRRLEPALGQLVATPPVRRPLGSGWVPVSLSGAVALTVIGLAAGPPAVTTGILGWAAERGRLAALTVGALAGVLLFAVTVATRRLVAALARRRRRVPAGASPGRVPHGPGRPTEPTRPDIPSSSGCPVASPPTPPGGCPETGSPAGGRTHVDPAEAEDFLRLFHAENPSSGPVGPRILEVRREIDATGTYWHTPAELAFGARAAWRNNSRCIGRLYWRSLQVRDLRTISTAAAVAAQCVEHLGAACNGGKIRPMISVFAPDTPARRAPRIWNEQLIRYAGYELPGGRVLGDPRYLAFTAEMIRRGWRAPEPRGNFDVLPLVVETPEEGPRLFALPDHAVQEVELAHPELPWFGDLGIRWHALPVISSSVLVIGGVSYPAAPFNGWYMGTEIGARNLGDSERYDLVPVIAERMGLDTSSPATLWRDRALVEINRAVLHSFHEQGVSITDHHTESERFLTHVGKEERAGRTCPADWSWIVPPMSGSQTPVFHRYYETEELLPNFFPDDGATQRALQGGPPAFG
jgi:nitric-oxide synthase